MKRSRTIQRRQSRSQRRKRTVQRKKSVRRRSSRKVRQVVKYHRGGGEMIIKVWKRSLE